MAAREFVQPSTRSCQADFGSALFRLVGKIGTDEGSGWPRASSCSHLRAHARPSLETTLEGRPKFDYEFWHDHLRPLGFNLKAEVLEYPEGMPGDIGLIL